MKYDKLQHYLENIQSEELILSFNEIEEIIGAPLPKSARQYSAWWANEIDGRHTQAQAWLNAGWITQDLNLTRATVTFREDGRIQNSKAKLSNPEDGHH